MNQQWSQFYKDAGSKQVILFGMGKMCEWFLNYGTNVNIKALIDNSPSKVNRNIFSIYPNLKEQHVQDPIIHSFEDVTSSADTSQFILLITTRYDDEILKGIDIDSFYNVYSLPKMNNDLVTKREQYDKLPLVDKKVVVFADVYGEHGKAITQKLLQMDDTVDVVWIVNKRPSDCSRKVRLVYRYDFESYYYEISTAKIWIVDLSVDADIKKKSGQIYFQVKHWSSITLKKFSCEDMKWASMPGAVEFQKKEAARTDYILSGSQFDEDSCRRGFMYNGPFVRVGSPRSDIIFQPEIKNVVRNKLGISEYKKVLLYAPTFRVSKDESFAHQHTEQGIDFELLRDSLTNKFNGEWIILLRLHPSVASSADGIKLPDYVKNVSKYDDSQELVACCDALISDYSSIIFEAAYVYKPIFLFTPDLDEYLKHERQLLLDYRELPFPISVSNGELKRNIEAFDEVKYRKCVENLFNKYQVHEDGHASERAAEFILGLMNFKGKL
ncbi:CDP-glycerol glycerophosphotransferase [Anaerovibrio lipolyticus DSM 3074]|uniref:CDP-glycerol glycerophosphotransferase n=2 Tax=Anaerovibrio lipolyticus TaxID=82374 RepID=A0A1M6AMM3_9FIRM|nr:CDP-glycerol glycerophosphotransferase [Anaerovibrio lipolyticus DSM 3074]